MPKRIILLFVLLGLLIWACTRQLPPSGSVTAPTSLREQYARPTAQWPTPQLDAGVVHRELDSLPAVPLDRADPQVRAEVELGKLLFFDPRLSASGQIACASCHEPQLGWGDGRARSFGHDRQPGARNAPSILNAAAWTTLFWDGRAATLEEQVLFPIQDQVEMHQQLARMEEVLNDIPAYRSAFQSIYGQPQVRRSEVARAIATFERTVVSRVSRFDRFVQGDYSALTDQEIRGLHLFRTRARCLNCHNGPFFTDQQFHNNGSHNYGRPQQDLGRYEHTRQLADLGKFRTPMLRDVLFTAPYFHHGNIQELREVMQMYRAGMPQIISARVRDSARVLPIHDPLLQPLELSDADIDDLLAFLGAISVRPRPVRAPELPQ